MLGEEDYFDRDLDWNRTRRGKFMSELSKWWIPKIIKIASLFKLDVVVHPSFSDNRDNRADLLDTIIGIPFTPTSTTLDSSATTDATSSLSSLAPDEDMPTASHTLSLVGRLQLTTRERRRFTRLVRLLHLEDEYNWGGAIQKPSGSSLGPISPEESRKQWKKRRGDPDVGYWLGSGEMSLEPALLMAHASGYFW
ncbi:hypothetical protein BDY24DRAFT_381665 [Mrakia frigida]|uniref:uncharacterized protein n=1 Tax=Mrakia frigida TaxID=29902 RepID=UPI003FCBF8BB